MSVSDDYPRNASHMHASTRTSSVAGSLPMDMIARTASSRVSQPVFVLLDKVAAFDPRVKLEP